MLRCFTAVAQSGNLADGAYKLSRSPSAVSMMLKQFEDHLGAPLFESERKGKLTALGSFVVEEAIHGINSFDRTVASIEGYARSEFGVVRVAAVPSVAEVILPRVVRDYLRDHPGVWVDIRDMDSSAVLRELERERVDIGLATGAGSGGEIESESLFADDFGVVCPADHPLTAAGSPLEWPALAPYPFIANGVCGVISDAVFQRIFAASILMVHNTTSLLAMVRAEVGLTVLPRLAIDDTERSLRFLPVSDARARRRVDILRRANTSLSPAARSFEDAIRRIAGTIEKVW